MLKRLNHAALAFFALLAVSLPASADGWDVSAVTAEITGAKPVIVAVGVAMLGAVALIVGYRLMPQQNRAGFRPVCFTRNRICQAPKDDTRHYPCPGHSARLLHPVQRLIFPLFIVLTFTKSISM